MPFNEVATSSQYLKMHAFIEGTRRHKQLGYFVSACAHTHPVSAQGGLPPWVDESGSCARRVAEGQGRAGFIALGRLDRLRRGSWVCFKVAGAGAAGLCRGLGLAPCCVRAVP